MREKIKEFMVGTLGTLGIVLYYLLGIALWILSLMPIYFLDLPFWGYFILIMIATIPSVGDLLLLVLWCITFPTILEEPFSTVVCLYYIGLADFVIAYLIPTLISIIGAIITMFRR